jgi:hypothetical protein
VAAVTKPCQNGRQPSRRLWDKGEAVAVVDAAAVEPRIRRREGREYTKANAAASKTTASNQRARAGGEMEVPTAANGAVVAAPWEEAVKEHGSNVLVVGGGRGWVGFVSRHVTGSHVFNKCRKTWDVLRQIGDIQDMSCRVDDMSATCAS